MCFRANFGVNSLCALFYSVLICLSSKISVDSFYSKLYSQKLPVVLVLLSGKKGQEFDPDMNIDQHFVRFKQMLEIIDTLTSSIDRLNIISHLLGQTFTVKILKFRTPEKFAVITLKFKQGGFSIE